MNQDLPAMMLQFVHHMKLALGERANLGLALKVCSTNKIQEHWQPLYTSFLQLFCDFLGMVWPASRLCPVTRFDPDDFQSVKQYPFISLVHDQHDWTAPSTPGPRPAAPHPGQSRITTGVCAGSRDNAQPTVANHRSPPATRHAHSNPPGPLIKLYPLPLAPESGHPTSPPPSYVPPIQGIPPVTAPTAPHHIARLSLPHKNNNQAIPHGTTKATISKIPRIKGKATRLKSQQDTPTPRKHNPMKIQGNYHAHNDPQAKTSNRP